MRIFIYYLSLSLCIFLAEVLSISVFQHGHIILALLLFFIFFLRPQTALFCACIAGLLEDIIVGPFGLWMITYTCITVMGIGICKTLLTNKSFFAFFLLEIFGFSLYRITEVLFFSFHRILTHQDIVFHVPILFEYVKDTAAQIFIICILYLIQYRRIRFSRAYLMFSESSK